jgi:nucleoside-diphosphate-sugar epimerase
MPSLDLYSNIESSRTGLDYREVRQFVLDSEPLLRQLSAASLLITGSTGWFGTWLLDLLCAADDILVLGLRITAVSRDPSRFLARFPSFAGDSRVAWLKTDIRKLQADAQSFTHIIHAAADTSTSSDAKATQDLFETIVDGTRRALSAVRPECKGFLFLSSGAVYGRAAKGKRFRESDAGGPNLSSVESAYSDGKKAAEQLCAIAAAEGDPVRIARCFAFVGPHMHFDRHFAIGNFIADAACGRTIVVKSDGRAHRSYLYMTDLIRALLKILCEGQVGAAYNVGSDVAFTIKEIAHCVNRVLGGAGVRIEGAPSDPADRYIPDTTRLRSQLNFVQEVTIESAITRTAAWYRARTPASVPLS